MHDTYTRTRTIIWKRNMTCTCSIRWITSESHVKYFPEWLWPSIKIPCPLLRSSFPKVSSAVRSTQAPCSIRLCDRYGIIKYVGRIGIRCASIRSWGNRRYARPTEFEFGSRRYSFPCGNSTNTLYYGACVCLATSHDDMLQEDKSSWNLIRVRTVAD